MSDSDRAKDEQFGPNPEDMSDYELFEHVERFGKALQKTMEGLIYVKLTNPQESRGLPRDAEGRLIGMHTVTLGPYLWVTVRDGEMMAGVGSEQDGPLTTPAEVNIATFDEDAGGWRVHSAAEGWQPVYMNLAFSTINHMTGKPMI